jgi:hypothetical protein
MFFEVLSPTYHVPITIAPSLTAALLKPGLLENAGDGRATVVNVHRPPIPAALPVSSGIPDSSTRSLPRNGTVTPVIRAKSLLIEPHVVATISQWRQINLTISARLAVEI